MVLKNGEYTCCYLFEMFASDMHQNEWFRVWFFKNFLGRGSPSPLPRPLPPFFLGLRPRFGLRPQFSGASRLRLGRFAPSIRAPPSTFGRRTWFGPPKINCWIRHCEDWSLRYPVEDGGRFRLDTIVYRATQSLKIAKLKLNQISRLQIRQNLARPN